MELPLKIVRELGDELNSAIVNCNITDPTIGAFATNAKPLPDNLDIFFLIILDLIN